jgi:hypothetical protein
MKVAKTPKKLVMQELKPMNITETLKEEYLDDTYTETKKPKR